MLRGPLVELGPVSAEPDLPVTGAGLFVVPAGVPGRVVGVAENVFAEDGQAVIDVQVVLGLQRVVAVL